jgi:hypothetical protein
VGRNELVLRTGMWAEPELRGATLATVPFSGWAGVGGTVGTITLSRVDREELVDGERWSSRDELAYAFEAPACDRFGQFAGQPWVRGTVVWTLVDRSVVIAGKREGEPSEEVGV